MGIECFGLRIHNIAHFSCSNFKLTLLCVSFQFHSASDAIFVLGHRKKSISAAYAAAMGQRVRCHCIIGTWSTHSAMCRAAVVSSDVIELLLRYLTSSYSGYFTELLSDICL